MEPLRDYVLDLVLLIGEVPTDTILARVRRDFPELDQRLELVGWLAFGAQSFYQLEDPLDRRKANKLLDLIIGLAAKEG
jgi:hypothetical protein